VKFDLFLEPEQKPKNSIRENFLLPAPSGNIRIPRAIALDDGNFDQFDSSIIVHDPEYGVELDDIGNSKPKKKERDICYVRVALNELKDNLEYLSQIRDELEREKNTLLRLKIIEEKGNKIR